MEEIGAQTISVPVTRIPQSLQRNIVATALIPFNVQPLLGLERHVTHFTEGYDQVRFGSVIFQVSMNASKWESLPADIKDAFRRASDEQFLKEIGQMGRMMNSLGLNSCGSLAKSTLSLQKKKPMNSVASWSPLWSADFLM